MARRQRHVVYLGHIPGTDNVSATVRVTADGSQFADLVNRTHPALAKTAIENHKPGQARRARPPTRPICAHRGPEVADVGRPRQEPQQLMNNAL